MFSVTKHKTRTIFFVLVWLFWFAWIGGPVHLRKKSEGKVWIDIFKYSNKDGWVSFSEKSDKMRCKYK